MKRIGVCLTLLLSLCEAGQAITYQSVRASTANIVTPSIQTGTMNLSSGTVTNLNATTLKGTTGTFSGTVTAGTFSGPGSGLTGVILNQATLQSGATFFTSSGTVNTLNIGTSLSGGINNKLTLVSTPTIVTDAATKGYVDTIANGSTNYIQNTSALQSGATLFVSSGTVATLRTGSLVSSGTVNLGGAVNSVTVSTNIVFSPTTAGIFGTTTNDNACPGCVGETVSSGTAQASAIGIVTGTAQRVGGVTLTPGQWDIIALGSFIAANTTQLLDQNFSINTSSTATASGVAMFQNAAGQVSMENDVKITASGSTLFPMVLHSVAKVSTTTIYYAVLASDFNTSTASVFGSIFATRMR